LQCAVNGKRGGLFSSEDVGAMQALARDVSRGPLIHALASRVGLARTRVDKERKGIGNTLKSFWSGSGSSSPSGESKVIGLPSQLRASSELSSGASPIARPALPLFRHDTKQMEAVWLAYLCQILGGSELGEARRLLSDVAREFQTDKSPIHAAAALGARIELELDDLAASVKTPVSSRIEFVVSSILPLVRDVLRELEAALTRLLNPRESGPRHVELPTFTCPPFQPSPELRPAAMTSMQMLQNPGPISQAQVAQMDGAAITAAAIAIRRWGAMIVHRWASITMELVLEWNEASKGSQSKGKGQSAQLVPIEIPRLLRATNDAHVRLLMWERPGRSVASALLQE